MSPQYTTTFNGGADHRSNGLVCTTVEKSLLKTPYLTLNNQLCGLLILK